MNIPFAGGCACGAVRYECSAKPSMMFKCLRRDCQRVTGGGFVASVLVPASAFRLNPKRCQVPFSCLITPVPPMVTGRAHRLAKNGTWHRFQRTGEKSGGIEAKGVCLGE